MVPLVGRPARAPRPTWSSRSTPTGRRWWRRCWRRGRASSTTSAGCSTPRSPSLRGRGRRRAGDHAHPGAAQAQGARRPDLYGGDVTADVVASCASGSTRPWPRGDGAGGDRSSTRGPTSPRPRPRPSRCCAGSTGCGRSAARCCWRCPARTSSAPSPGARPGSGWRARWRRSGHVAAGPGTILRVHDVAEVRRLPGGGGGAGRPDRPAGGGPPGRGPAPRAADRPPRILPARPATAE